MQATPYFNEVTSLRSQNENNGTQILYNNDLLFFDEVETEKYNFTANLERTAKKFIRHYSFGQEDNKYDTIYHYFVDVREENVATVNELYVKYGDKYFDKSSTTAIGTYNLKSEYITLFKPNFEKAEETNKVKKWQEFGVLIIFTWGKYNELEGFSLNINLN